VEYLPVERVDRVLVVTAHPDDVDFGVAGSIAKWVQQGSEVSYLVVTDGDAGGFDLTVDRSKIPEIRRAEQREAARIVGVRDVEFLGYPDGAVVGTPELRKDISRAIRRTRPDRVVCQSPERSYLRLPASHPDHRATGDAALNAVYPDARNPFAFPELLAEGLSDFIVHEVLLMAHPEINAYEDVTATIDRKLEAISAHQSQLAQPEELGPRVRGWLSATAEAVGLPQGSFAEGFFRLTLQ
jgi:LmbE family N-acetylglucosaminyl deacetylase